MSAKEKFSFGAGLIPIFSFKVFAVGFCQKRFIT